MNNDITNNPPPIQTEINPQTGRPSPNYTKMSPTLAVGPQTIQNSQKQEESPTLTSHKIGKMEADKPISNLSNTTLLKQESSQSREMAWITERCPEITQEFQKAMHILEESENPKNTLEQRLKNTPDIPPRTASGCYFLKSDTEPKAYSFVAKPSIQESNAPGHPDYKPDTVSRSGIAGGHGAFRERLAYTVQKTLGIDCGVPPTTLTMVKHSLLGMPTLLEKNLAEFSKHFGFKNGLTRDKFIAYSEGHSNFGVFKANMQDIIMEKVSKLIAEVSGEDQKKLISNLVHDESITTFKGLETNEFYLYVEGKYRYNLNFIMTSIIFLRNAENTFNECWAELSNPTPPKIDSLCSLQKFIPNTISLEVLLAKYPDDQTLPLAPKEFEKFVLDFAIVNLDRHTGNVLTKPVSTDELMNRLEKAGIKKEHLQNWLESKKSVTDFLSIQPHTLKTNTEIEAALHSLHFATKNNFQEVYELILIDHGFTLPSMDTHFDNIDGLISHVLELIPDDANFTGIIKEKLSKLNVDEYMHTILEDQRSHENRFGENCSLGTETKHLLRLNAVILKTAANHDIPLLKIKEFFKGDIKSVFKAYIQNKNSIDWSLVGQKIEESLNSN